MTIKRAVSYVRVSTARQGRSGLGLDAQREAVTQFVNNSGWELIGQYTEVESGKRADRPQLAAALAACRLHGATLVIAKLDRLARNVEFINVLMNTGAEFLAVDQPHATRLTVNIISSMAEFEREQISARTKAALAQAKLRGVKLGGNRGNIPLIAAQGARASAVARQERSAQRAADLRPIIAQIETAGTTSLTGIAAALNAMKVSAPRGGQWSAGQVRRVRCM